MEHENKFRKALLNAKEQDMSEVQENRLFAKFVSIVFSTGEIEDEAIKDISMEDINLVEKYLNEYDFERINVNHPISRLITIEFCKNNVRRIASKAMPKTDDFF